MTFWAIAVGIVLLAIGMLWLRDRGLKKRGKTTEQINAASRANVASYVALRRLGIGMIFLIGAVADYANKEGITIRAVLLGLVGLLFLGFGIDQFRKRVALQKFVDS